MCWLLNLKGKPDLQHACCQSGQAMLHLRLHLVDLGPMYECYYEGCIAEFNLAALCAVAASLLG